MKEMYRNLIAEMLSQISSEKFLRQIWTIMKRHVEREEAKV